MRIETTRFGVVEVGDQSIISAPEGILGFEQCKRLVLLEDDSSASSFKWLQAVDQPGIAFIVINPLEFLSDYEVELTDEQAELLALENPAEAVMFTTVTVRQDTGEITTNLMGPIVVNIRTLQARQIIVEDERYGVRHLIGHMRSADEEYQQALIA